MTICMSYCQYCVYCENSGPWNLHTNISHVQLFLVLLFGLEKRVQKNVCCNNYWDNYFFFIIYTAKLIALNTSTKNSLHYFQQFLRNIWVPNNILRDHEINFTFHTQTLKPLFRVNGHIWKKLNKIVQLTSFVFCLFTSWKHEISMRDHNIEQQMTKA